MICMLSQQALALKGKCLRLGIDYCRQDLGKTVIVRDVFYNQPVRRKQMHSNYRHWDLLRWTTMHAADERIRLEERREKVLSGKNEDNNLS
ncbi:uncharacterized protein LOC129872130 isoform X1 [Solanum dulcamara]|uniref:uncharacterized protein LOC129872130 isoform X1 n=1 Tax=Solanum dulcamara TaxID=45834 RepID=UPI0024863AA1|nr:uncharacterized protein LOC129872130 isoform X1 [Solanum dulcamara]XP_055802998.1 uncharacterized protein LOC129872130 isoform X1 [Solanum dulcamara]